MRTRGTVFKYGLLFALVGWQGLGAEDAAISPFGEAKVPAKKAAQEINLLKKEFKDVLVPTKADGSIEGAEGMNSVPPDERAAYLAANAREAWVVLSQLTLRNRLSAPVTLPQVIRYLNAEIQASHLPYRVRLYLGDDPDVSFMADRYRRHLLSPLTPPKDLPGNGKEYVLASALREGTVKDILSAVSFSILPSAVVVVHKGGLIYIGPNMANE